MCINHYLSYPIHLNIILVRNCGRSLVTHLHLSLVHCRKGRAGKKVKAVTWPQKVDRFLLQNPTVTDRSPRGTCPKTPTGFLWRLREVSPSGFVASRLLADGSPLFSCSSPLMPNSLRLVRTRLKTST